MSLDAQNFSKFRRMLQGWGVDQKYSILTGVDNDPNIGTRTPVSGLKDDDVVTAIINGATGADMQSTFVPDVYAATVINDEVANAALLITNRVKGVVRYAVISDTDASYPVVEVDNNASGQARITVNAKIGTVTAAMVRTAILQHPEASKLVSVVFNGADSGVGLVTALTEMTIGTDPDTHTSGAVTGYHNVQGDRFARLVVNGEFIVEAQDAGDDGNDISIEVTDTDQATLTVSVYLDTITVDLATVATVPVSTIAEVVAAINADATASAMVRAAIFPTPEGRVAGDAVASVFSEDNLVGGQDAGIVLDGDFSAATAIKVEWLSRRNATGPQHSI